MELANCVRCGKVFARIGRNICPDCQAEEDRIFKKVRAFVEENPGLTIQEVADQCDIQPKKIYDFLKEGRLEGRNFAAGSARWQCASCGSYITSGKLCNKCKETLQAELQANKRSAVGPAPYTKKDKGEIHISRWRERRGS